jgi:predicted nucleic acid-binding Zn finger protein
VLIPSAEGLDCTCANYLKGLVGEGHRYCEHVLCIKIVNRLKDGGRIKVKEMGLLEFVNELKAVVIV